MKHLCFLLVSLAGAMIASAQTPTVVDGGVINGASFAKGQPVSPGGLVSIFGTGLVSKLAKPTPFPCPAALVGSQ